VTLTREGLEEVHADVTVHEADEIDEAWAFLTRADGYEGAPRPDLVLLDLNLPGHGGHNLLERMQDSRELAMVPVAILSTSNAAEDIERAYELGANSYVRKPSDYEEFKRQLRVLGEY